MTNDDLDRLMAERVMKWRWTDRGGGCWRTDTGSVAWSACPFSPTTDPCALDEVIQALVKQGKVSEIHMWYAGHGDWGCDVEASEPTTTHRMLEAHGETWTLAVCRAVAKALEAS